jgi:hypothetical protein
MDYNFDKDRLLALFGVDNTLTILDYMVTNHIYEGSLSSAIKKGCNYRVELVDDYTYHVYCGDTKVLPVGAKITQKDLKNVKEVLKFYVDDTYDFENVSLEVEGYSSSCIGYEPSWTGLCLTDQLAYVVRDKNSFLYNVSGDLYYLKCTELR